MPGAFPRDVHFIIEKNVIVEVYYLTKKKLFFMINYFDVLLIQ
jgi:hypothetical protein